MAAAVIAIALVALVLGRLVISHPGFSEAVAAGVAGAALTAFATGPVLVLALPAVFVSHRVGPGALNMSVSDVMLLAAFAAALPLVDWRNHTVRRLAGVIAAYEGILVVTVVADPTQRAIFEWAHRGVLLLGGVAVGAAVVRVGSHVRALRLLSATAALVSIASVLQGLATGLRAAYPFGLQKNDAGVLCAITLLVVWVAPDALRVRRGTVTSLQFLLFLGVLFTQSRGAAVALGGALLLWAVTAGRRDPRRLLLVPLALVVAVMVVVSLRVDNARVAQRSSLAAYTSQGSRAVTNQVADQVWHDHPLFGAGLRYFRAPGYSLNVAAYGNGLVETHSVWYSTLAESGVVGLAALAVLLGGTFWALLGARGPLISAAVLVVVLILLQGFVEIFWVAGPQTLPWLVVGLAAASSVVGAAPSPPPESVRPPTLRPA